MSLETYLTGNTIVLYDTMHLANVTPSSAWFTSSFWQARGAVTGQAPGRGASLFVSAASVLPSDRQWVLRIYLRGGLAARISETRYVWAGLERTRAFRELRLTAALHERGLPVPTPVAGCVWRHGPTYEAGLLTERLMGAQALAEILPNADDALLARVGDILRRFHEAGLDHVDLNARNLLITPDERVWLIDLDRCRLRRPGSWQEANLKRLQRSLERFSPGQGEAGLRKLLRGYWQK